MAYMIEVNHQKRAVDVDGQMPQLWVLRDELKLKGTKFGELPAQESNQSSAARAYRRAALSHNNLRLRSSPICQLITTPVDSGKWLSPCG